MALDIVVAVGDRLDIALLVDRGSCKVAVMGGYLEACPVAWVEHCAARRENRSEARHPRHWRHWVPEHSDKPVLG